ncbi:hypothetical protein D3C73_1191670 [compost metagenome]
MSVQRLAVIQALVINVFVTGRQQKARSQLLGKACLAIAGDFEQRLQVPAAAVTQGHASINWPAPRTYFQTVRVFRGGPHRHFSLHIDTR